MSRPVAILSLLLLAGCGDESNPITEPKNADAHRALLASLAEHVILPTYERFAERAGTLIGADDPRAAFTDAMDTWQEAEVFQFGPAGVMGEVLGGDDLRDEIYSWTTVNPCRVDQELVEQAYLDADAFASEPVNVRGLDALEYLLFAEGTGNACKPNSRINEDGAWAALSAEELTTRRLAYAQTVATILKGHADALVTAWSPTGADFATALATAGAGSEVYPSAREALNAVSDAMFYVEKSTKDMKLGETAGLIDCATDTCPDALESKYAHRSRENIIANLRGFKALLTGGDADAAIGFVDLLEAVGSGALGTRLVNEVDAAIAALEAIDTTLTEALANDPAVVRAAYDTLKVAVTSFKTDFLAVLDLEIPARAASDND